MKRCSKGFVMTTEAAFSLLLLASAASALALFNFPQHDSQGFFLCSDAAIVLAKSLPSEPDVQSSVESLAEISGMCVEAEFGGGSTYVHCAGYRDWGGEKFSFSLKAFRDGEVRQLKVACARPR